jgi:hypothetical protein
VNAIRTTTQPAPSQLAAAVSPPAFIYAPRRHELWHDPEVEEGPQQSSGPDESHNLTSDQQAWLAESEIVWRQAHTIAAAHPEHDPSDLYHALRCLRLSPTERLRCGLTRGRLRTQSR